MRIPNTVKTSPVEDSIKTMGGNYITDPSSLTTQQLWREIASLKELLMTRIYAIEKAIEVAHEDMVRFPTEVDKRVGNLQALHDEKIDKIKVDLVSLQKIFNTELAGEHQLKEEKFLKVEQRFNLVEEARKEQKLDTNEAINRAFAAAKEAVIEQNKANMAAITKSEASIQKQIDQLEQLGSNGRQSLEDKINDVKDRVTKIEGVGSGKQSLASNIVGLIGLAIAAVSIIFAITKS